MTDRRMQLHPAVFLAHGTGGVYRLVQRERRRRRMFRDGGCRLLGICAVALGAGMSSTTIFLWERCCFWWLFS